MTRARHVAVVARSVFPLHGFGGLERSVYDLVRHLARAGVRVTLITRTPQRGAPSLDEPGITTKIVENGLNVPYEIVAGDTDEEVPISGVRHQVEREPTIVHAGGDAQTAGHGATGQLEVGHGRESIGVGVAGDVSASATRRRASR